jgi:hypothetical protein
MHYHVAGIVAVEKPDIAFFPDFVGAAHDIIYDINIIGIETGQGLTPGRGRAFKGQHFADILTGQTLYGRDRRLG